MRFALEIATIAVRPQDLQRAEQHKMRQRTTEQIGIKRLLPSRENLLLLIQIRSQQRLPQRIGIIGLSLPQEGCNIVLHRPTAPALKVNEIGLQLLATRHDHHITALKISIHKAIDGMLQQIARQSVEIVFQQVLTKLYLRALKETILPIVQIPHHGAMVECRHGIADRPIETANPLYLNMCQTAKSTLQQGYRLGRELPRSTPLLNEIEQQGIA